MVLLLLSGLSLVAWAYLALGRDGYWRSDGGLPPTPDPLAWPPVAVVIPARNEAENIRAVIAAHMACDYPGEVSVVLVDDHSTDGTAEVALQAAGGAQRLSIVAAPPLASGWTGKMNAVAYGVAAAPESQYLLLTDADIVLAPSALRRLVATAEVDNIALTSLLARLDCRGFWGRLLIPAFVYFFRKLYPFPASNDQRRRLAAAAGGCILVRRDALEAAGGIDSIRDRLIDDCALAERIKHAVPGGQRIFIALADDEAVSLRDNRSLGSIWSMVARTAFAQLNHSWWMLAGTLLGMVLLYLSPPLVAIASVINGNTPAATLAAAAWLVMSMTYLPTLLHYRQSSWMALTLPAAALFYTLMTASSAARHASGKGGQWKGRTYP